MQVRQHAKCLLSFTRCNQNLNIPTISIKIPKAKFHEYPSAGSGAVPCEYRRTYVHDEATSLWASLARTHLKTKEIVTLKQLDMNTAYRYNYKKKFQHEVCWRNRMLRLYRLACSMQYHGTHLQQQVILNIRDTKWWIFSTDICETTRCIWNIDRSFMKSGSYSAISSTEVN